ncbi:hypothetical protein BKA82DRAFT_4022803 [Pisolithus tinctorius]|nr:hypothetical protein BKA82DRAFT_4022803 [Pisolithus tinctorius]
MPSMIKSISPFYNHDSAAPPPFPTMLTDQLELLGKASCSKSSGLLADKVLPPAHTLSSKKVHVSEVLAQSQKSTLAPEFIVASKTPATWFGSPYLKRAPSQACSESTSTPSTSSDKEEVASSDNDLTSSIQLELKVPKPPGEPGHPGRGSYTLETVLNLNQKKYMHALINKHLDTKKCLSVQDPALLKVICQKAVDKFLDLEVYSNYWIVNDMIMMRLKYTSSCARQQESELATSKGKKIKTTVHNFFSLEQLIADHCCTQGDGMLREPKVMVCSESSRVWAILAAVVGFEISTPTVLNRMGGHSYLASFEKLGQLKVKDKICLGNSQPQDSSMPSPPLHNVASYKAREQGGLDLCDPLRYCTKLITLEFAVITAQKWIQAKMAVSLEENTKAARLLE